MTILECKLKQSRVIGANVEWNKRKKNISNNTLATVAVAVGKKKKNTLNHITHNDFKHYDEHRVVPDFMLN